LRQQIARLKSDLKHEEGRIKPLKRTIGDLEKRIGDLEKSLRAWREAFDVMREDNDFIRQQAFDHSEEWNRIESTQNKTIERMTEQIFQLRSDIEETKIIESDLLEGYNALIATIKGCTGMLAYYQGSSEGWTTNEKTVRANLGFNSLLLSPLSLHEYLLPAEILRLVTAEAEKHLYPHLTQWKDLHGVELVPFGAALNKFEEDVTRLIGPSQASGETSSAAGKGERSLAGNQKSKVLPNFPSISTLSQVSR
jgi:hypothetical protein